MVIIWGGDLSTLSNSDCGYCRYYLCKGVFHGNMVFAFSYVKSTYIRWFAVCNHCLVLTYGLIQRGKVVLCGIHQRDRTQRLRKEGQYSESHKRIFILNKDWTNMRALNGDSLESPKLPFVWKVEDWLPRSTWIDLVDVGERQSYLVPRSITLA